MLLSLHVVAAIVLIGPITVAATLFPGTHVLLPRPDLPTGDPLPTAR